MTDRARRSTERGPGGPDSRRRQAGFATPSTPSAASPEGPEPVPGAGSPPRPPVVPTASSPAIPVPPSAPQAPGIATAGSGPVAPSAPRAPEAPDASPAASDLFEQDTELNPRIESGAVELATPTDVDASVPAASAARPERSEPIRVISMKALGQAAPRAEPPVPLHVQLRSLAQISGSHELKAGLGHLAPPRDPHEVRARRARGNAALAGIVVALAAAIALAIWVVAGR